MPARSLPRVLGATALSLSLLMGASVLSACSEDELPPIQPLAGSKPGSQRYVVHLQGPPPDASAYHEALKDDPSKAPEIAATLKESAAASRKKLVQALRAYDGRVVDHWWLTNAVTVEIPAGNALSLTAIDGVVKVEPDQLLAE